MTVKQEKAFPYNPIIKNEVTIEKMFGKWDPQMLYIYKGEPTYWKEDVSEWRKVLDIPCDGTVYWVKLGTFFITKKGTPAFRHEYKGTHRLVCVKWGGHSSSRGRVSQNILEKALYHHRAKSRMGKEGYTYLVLPPIPF